MPNVDGPSAVKIIRNLGFSKPIIGVTGNSQDIDIKNFISSGATSVLLKPFLIEEFNKIIK